MGGDGLRETRDSAVSGCKPLRPMGQGGCVTFESNESVGVNWEGEAPAEPFTNHARQEPRTPVEIASKSKRK